MKLPAAPKPLEAGHEPFRSKEFPGWTHEVLHRDLTPYRVGRFWQMGLQLQNPGILGSPFRKLPDRYCLIYLLSGEGRFQDSAGLDVPVAAGDLMLLFPDRGHCYRPKDSGRWDELYANFNGPFVDEVVRQGIISSKNPIFHLEPVSYWRTRIESVHAPLNQTGEEIAFQRVCKFLQLLSEIRAHANSSPAHQENILWLDHAKAQLNQCVGTVHVDWRALARKTKTSSDYFRKKFTALSGMTPSRYLAERNMEWACERLHDSGISMKQIADHLGFADPFQFSRRFKQIVGISPSIYRNQVLQGSRAHWSRTRAK